MEDEQSELATMRANVDNPGEVTGERDSVVLYRGGDSKAQAATPDRHAQKAESLEESPGELAVPAHAKNLCAMSSPDRSSTTRQPGG